MTSHRNSARRLRSSFVAALVAALAVPGLASAQLGGRQAPGPDAPPGGVLGGEFCRDLATMLAILEQRGTAYRLAAEALRARPGVAASQAAERAEVESVKVRHEAAPMHAVYARRCDRSLLPRETAPTPAAAGTPLGIEIPASLAATDGWVLMTGGTMRRPWRDDAQGRQVRSDLWMYLSDADGLIYAEPVIGEDLDGARYTMRMTCRQVAMTDETGFLFEATVRNFPDRRYVAEGRIEVTGPMTLVDGAPGWPVRVRYAFSYQHRGEDGVIFAEGGSYQGEGIVRRLSDTPGRMRRRTQTLDHGCDG